MIAWFAAIALGSDLSVTTVGVQAMRADALDAQDTDLLLGQRVRWGLADHLQALVDVRLTLDPDGATTWEQSRVRTLGVRYDHGALLLVGRHALQHGGPRLLDGAQLLVHPASIEALEVGAWVGLAPDPFTTRPLIRPGLGPVVAWSSSSVSASALGEVLWRPSGIDRVGGLFTTRVSWAPTLSLSGRVDWVAADAQGRSGLADGAAAVRITPSDAVRLEAAYSAFSTLLYQTSAVLDPAVQRFQQRVADLDLQNIVLQDSVDPSLQQVVSGAIRVRPTSAIAPLAGATARGRSHADPEERSLRVGPYVGVAGLAGGRLELVADGSWLWAEGRAQIDLGLGGIAELTQDGGLLVDASVRSMLDPLADSGRPGWYADGFVDVVAASGTVISAGGSATSVPSNIVGADVGIGAFLRLQQWIRP